MAKSNAKPFTITVLCSGTRHRITWRAGQLLLHDHTTSGLALTQLLHTTHRCAKILDAVQHQRLSLLPRTLAKAITTHPAVTRLPSVLPTDTDLILPQRGTKWMACGANGWFQPVIITITTPSDTSHRKRYTQINIISRQPYRYGPPAFLRGPKRELIELLETILHTLRGNPTSIPMLPLPHTTKRTIKSKAAL